MERVGNIFSGSLHFSVFWAAHNDPLLLSWLFDKWSVPWQVKLSGETLALFSPGIYSLCGRKTRKSWRNGLVVVRIACLACQQSRNVASGWLCGGIMSLCCTPCNRPLVVSATNTPLTPQTCISSFKCMFPCPLSKGLSVSVFGTSKLQRCWSRCLFLFYGSPADLLMGNVMASVCLVIYAFMLLSTTYVQHVHWY